MKKMLLKVTKITENTLVVGIDIGKDTHYAYLRTITLEEYKSFSFVNTKQGFDYLLKRIRSFVKSHYIKDVVIGLESTGNCWLPLAHYIKNNTDYTLVQVNSKHTKKFKDVTDNTSNKNDQKDPRVIAQIVLIGSSLRVNLPVGTKATLRELTRTRRSITEERKRIYNRLFSLLLVYNPELCRLFRDITCKTCIYLLEHYPFPGSLEQVSGKKLANDLRRISRGRFTIDKTNTLLKTSRESVSVTEGLDGYISSVRLHLDQIKLYTSQIKEVEARIEGLVISVPEYILLKSIKGFGKITAATVISEIGDFSSFRTNNEILKYAGLNLIENSSGKHQSNKRISKIGNEHLRTSIYFAAMRLIKKGGLYHKLYNHHLEKGMIKRKAVIAISRKLLCTVHSMIRTQRSFIIEYKHERTKKVA